MKINLRVSHLLSMAAAFIALLHASSAQAQSSNSSPYSRYGIGDLAGKGFAQGFSMGGTSIAIQNDTTPLFFINNGNPASYANNGLTCAELGAGYTRLTLHSETESKAVNSAALNYIALAFPIKKFYWTVSVGLIPFSSVGYKVSDEKDITGIGKVNFLYEGSGGINQLYLGNGFRPWKASVERFRGSARYRELAGWRTSAMMLKDAEQKRKDSILIRRIVRRREALRSISGGVNVSYLFGNFQNTRRSIFPGSTNSFNTRTGVTTRVSDIYLDYGLQYTFRIDSVKNRRQDSLHRGKNRILTDKVRFTLGATFAAQTNMNASIDSLTVSYFNTSLGTEVVKDTVSITDGTKGTISIPMTFGFGASFRKGNHWLVAADFSMQNWSDFRAFNTTPGLRNSTRISLGGQYCPANLLAVHSSYLERTQYRLGVRYAQTALELKTTQLTEYAVVLGFGLPMTNSMVNLGFEYGQRGTISNGLIRENFFNVHVGFTINDRWFVKPHFD